MTYGNSAASVSEFKASRAAARTGNVRDAHGGLFAALWRRRLIFSSTFAAILGITVVALLVLPVQYMATGSVIVAEQEPGDNNSSPAWAQKVGDPADMESQLLIIGSSRVMKAAMSAPGMLDVAKQDCAAGSEAGPLSRIFGSSRSTCDALKSDDNALIEYVRTRYSAGDVGRSRVISISYRSPRPIIAQQMANALITAFLDDQRRTSSSSRQQAAAWLWGEVRRLDGELRDDDAKIQEYRRTKGLARGATALSGSERLTGVTQQLSTAEATRAEAASRLKEITANKGIGLADSPAVMASRTVADLKQQLTVVEVRLAAARSTLGALHPTLRELERERDMVQRRFLAEVAGVAASAKRNYDAANALVASLKAQVEAAKSEVGAAMIDEGSIETLVRGAEIKRREYSELYKRASELDTDRQVLQGSTRLVSLAELPNQPYFPKRLPFLAAGLTLATLFGATAAILRDRIDKSLRSSAELVAATGEELCVELPRLRGKAPAKKFNLLTRREPNPPLRLALKLARHDDALQRALFDLYSGAFPADDEEFRIVAVTSPLRGEGKTFLTLAFAQFVATMGHNVLVVECDVANPSFESALGLKPGPGLLEALEGTIHPRKAVVATSLQNLDALRAGGLGKTTPPQIGKRIWAVLKWTRQYDLVLLDCPPAETLDTRLLVDHADGLLLCARAGKSSAEQVLAAGDGLSASGGEVLGLVVNMVERDDAALLKRFTRIAA